MWGSGELAAARERFLCSGGVRMRIVRDPGALSGAHGPAVGPRSPPARTTFSQPSLWRALTGHHTGPRLIAGRSVSTTGNVTLRLPGGPIPPVSRHYYWHPGADADPRAGPTR